jgi:hypothetical protein
MITSFICFYLTPINLLACYLAESKILGLKFNRYDCSFCFNKLIPNTISLDQYIDIICLSCADGVLRFL